MSKSLTNNVYNSLAELDAYKYRPRPSGADISMNCNVSPILCNLARIEKTSHHALEGIRLHKIMHITLSKMKNEIENLKSCYYNKLIKILKSDFIIHNETNIKIVIFNIINILENMEQESSNFAIIDILVEESIYDNSHYVGTPDLVIQLKNNGKKICLLNDYKFGFAEININSYQLSLYAYYFLKKDVDVIPIVIQPSSYPQIKKKVLSYNNNIKELRDIKLKFKSVQDKYDLLASTIGDPHIDQSKIEIIQSLSNTGEHCKYCAFKNKCNNYHKMVTNDIRELSNVYSLEIDELYNLYKKRNIITAYLLDAEIQLLALMKNNGGKSNLSSDICIETIAGASRKYFEDSSEKEINSILSEVGIKCVFEKMTPSKLKSKLKKIDRLDLFNKLLDAGFIIIKQNKLKIIESKTGDSNEL